MSFANARPHLSSLLRHAAVALFAAATGAAVVTVLHVRGGPPLEVWHTARLDREFTADAEPPVATLDAYLALEDHLFDELDRDVYARTDSGPAFRFARYSSGSLPDPRHREPNWNRTFELAGNGRSGSVLLLHGMSDSPYSLRAVGQLLHDRGYQVVGLRLPGHGTAPSSLMRVRWEDMAAAVRIAADHLAAPAGPFFLVGYSTGAALAVQYTLTALGSDEHPLPAGLVLISPAMGVTPLARLARWNVRLAHLPGLDRLAWQSVVPEFDPYKYGSFAVNAGAQVHSLTEEVGRRIARRARTAGMSDFPPVLVFASAADATVPVATVVERLLDHLAPGTGELVLFDVNRRAAGSTVMVGDPAPLVSRLLEGQARGYGVTIVGNASPESDTVVARRRGAGETELTTHPLGLRWPPGVFSLSHVALPFPPDDPLYGAREPTDPSQLYLGQLPIQGERGVLAFPADWLLRLRHNPFWSVMAARMLEWSDAVRRKASEKSTETSTE